MSSIHVCLEQTESACLACQGTETFLRQEQGLHARAFLQMASGNYLPSYKSAHLEIILRMKTAFAFIMDYYLNFNSENPHFQQLQDLEQSMNALSLEISIF